MEPHVPAYGTEIEVTLQYASSGVMGNVTCGGDYKTSWNNSVDKPGNGSAVYCGSGIAVRLAYGSRQVRPPSMCRTKENTHMRLTDTESVLVMKHICRTAFLDTGTHS
jgi:hypothetical protein